MEIVRNRYFTFQTEEFLWRNSDNSTNILMVLFSLSHRTVNNNYYNPQITLLFMTQVSFNRTLLTWLISEMGELFIIEFFLLFSWQGCEILELLGVGVTVVLMTGWTLMILSFWCLFGDILAGKLKVFVHWAKLRTMVKMSTQKLVINVHFSINQTEPTLIKPLCFHYVNTQILSDKYLALFFFEVKHDRAMYSLTLNCWRWCSHSAF